VYPSLNAETEETRAARRPGAEEPGHECSAPRSLKHNPFEIPDELATSRSRPADGEALILVRHEHYFEPRWRDFGGKAFLVRHEYRSAGPKSGSLQRNV
jgi:hypothetical protein